MKILIVEDDLTSRVLLQELLTPLGECHAVVNGKEALAAFAKALKEHRPYDLLCVDIMMPEMDGQTALKEIRAQEEALGIYSHRGAKIIMTTALDDVHNIMDAFHGLCDGYLVKPIAKAKLLELIGKLIPQNRAA